MYRIPSGIVNKNLKYPRRRKKRQRRLNHISHIIYFINQSITLCNPQTRTSGDYNVVQVRY